MPKCSYCGRDYEPPKGLSLVLKDGSVKFLCSAKCRKNFSMKRRKVRWVSKKKKEKNKAE
jgi:large subunit ribosomal protein L24e